MRHDYYINLRPKLSALKEKMSNSKKRASIEEFDDIKSHRRMSKISHEKLFSTETMLSRRLLLQIEFFVDSFQLMELPRQ